MIYIRGKIPIEIHGSFWLLAGFLAVLNAQTLMSIPVWVGLIFISILVHEWGHAITAHIFGNKSKITLMGIGGLSTYKANRPLASS